MATELERRPLGKTGESLSILGMGGIVVMDEEQSRANGLVCEAIEAGVNYFDVAPEYGDAQAKLGPALEPFRNEVFLACKTDERGREGSRAQLEESLKLLRTDRFDLYQLHGIATSDEVEQIFGPDGAMETLLEARRDGKARFLGITAHSTEAALAAMEYYDFDTVLLALNSTCWFAGNYGPRVVFEAERRGMGILALKAGAHSAYPEGEEKEFAKCWYKPLTDPDEMRLSYSFTLSLPVTAALPPGDEHLWRQAIQMAHRFTVPRIGEVERLKKMAGEREPLFRHPAWE